MTPAEAEIRLAALLAAVATAVSAALDGVAAAVAAEARRRVGGEGPSRPGEPPADPSGALAAAIDTGRDPDGAALVTVARSYAADLEYGTRRMVARPFLRPAVAATGDEARRSLAAAFARAVSATLSDSQ